MSVISKDAYQFYICILLIHYWLLEDIFIFIEVKMHFNDRPVGPAAGSQRKSHWPVGPAAGSEIVKKIMRSLIFLCNYLLLNTVVLMLKYATCLLRTTFGLMSLIIYFHWGLLLHEKDQIQLCVKKQVHLTFC